MGTSSKMLVLACIALLFLLAPFALAQANAIIQPVFSSIEVSISQTDYLVRPGEEFELNFELKNVVDDDSSIQLLDVYLLDLEAQGFSIVHYSPLWSFEHFVEFQDEHFSIENASSQELAVTLKAVEGIEVGEKKLKGYYNFMDSDGLQWGLADNKAIKPLSDGQNHVFAIVRVIKGKEEEQSQEPETTESALETSNTPLQASSASMPLPAGSSQQGSEASSAGIEESQENEIENSLKNQEQQTQQQQQIQQQEQEQQKQQKQQKQGASIFSALKPEVQEYDAGSFEKSIIMWVLKAILGLLSS